MPRDLSSLMNSALRHVNATCVFGAYNRQDDLLRTGDWTDRLYDYNYFEGGWYIRDDLPLHFERPPIP